MFHLNIFFLNIFNNGIIHLFDQFNILQNNISEVELDDTTQEVVLLNSVCRQR